MNNCSYVFNIFNFNSEYNNDYWLMMRFSQYFMTIDSNGETIQRLAPDCYRVSWFVPDSYRDHVSFPRQLSGSRFVCNGQSLVTSGQRLAVSDWRLAIVLNLNSKIKPETLSTNKRINNSTNKGLNASTNQRINNSSLFTVQRSAVSGQQSAISGQRLAPDC